MKKNNQNSIYLAWQSPESRDWFVVGLLRQIETGFSFNYTKGALSSKLFIPFSGMESLDKTYMSSELFPLFKNRLLSKRRPEYPKFLKWLSLEATDDISPLDILGRSGGIRGTDQLQTFQRVALDENNQFEHFFFVHGLSYLTEESLTRVGSLTTGEQLFLCLDCQNQYDNKAVLIRANNPSQIVGYCPRYLANDIQKLLQHEESKVTLTVEVLDKDAPSNYQLMCKLSGKMPSSLAEEYMNDSEYMTI